MRTFPFFVNLFDFTSDVVYKIELAIKPTMKLMNGILNSYWEVPTIRNNGKCHKAQTKPIIIPGEVLLFASKPVIKDVIEAVERCAVLPSE